MSGRTYRATDPAVLMAAAGDRDTFVALSQTFLACAPPIAGQLEQALAAERHDAIGRHSHALKGMTMLVGAAELTALLQQLETAARQSHAVPEAARRLASCFDQVLREVAQAIDDPVCGGH